MIKQNPKSQRIIVRVSPDELDIIKRHARKAGLTLSAYTRKKLLNEPVSVRPPEEYFALRRDIAGLCNNVNQIAHAVNSGIKHPIDAVEEARRLAQQTYAIVKRMAG